MKSYIRGYGNDSYLQSDNTQEDPAEDSASQAQELPVKTEESEQVASTSLSVLPSSVTPRASSVLTKPAVTPTLESICTGASDSRRSELAEKINGMWTDTKSKTLESDYPTACVAVFKVAQWLGMIHEDIKAPQWKAILLARYNVSVTDGLSKYRISTDYKKSKIFRKAVLNAFAYAERHMALLAKNHALPAGYYIAK